MARHPTAGRAGRNGGGRGGRGGRFPKRNKALAPRCKDLNGNVFTIGPGNKGKDGDLLRTSKEKLALYIGTNYEDDACQEWMSEKQLVLLEPTYPPDVLARQLVRERAISARVTKMITNLETRNRRSPDLLSNLCIFNGDCAAPDASGSEDRFEVGIGWIA